jgi:hypothetical protein
MHTEDASCSTTDVLVQREMESWRSPLASIPLFSMAHFVDTAQCSGGWYTS